MGGRAEPPEGAPEGGSGGEDEFRSVVFDESFVRAARIQELSASERLGGSGGGRSARRRGMRGGLPRQALALMLLISLAFAAAVYMGVRHPYPEVPSTATQLTIEIVPLQPDARPSAGASHRAPTTTAAPSLADPWASAVQYEDYVTFDNAQWLPNPVGTAHFSKAQVGEALRSVWSYLSDSTANPQVLQGRDTDSVARWLTSGQRRQFDAAVKQPLHDQRHELTGWMVRFDPNEWVLATTEVRVSPSVSRAVTFSELEDGTLEIVSDYTSVYALLPARDAENAQALTYFSVRRQIHYRLTAADIADGRVELVDSVVQAGPMACNAPNIESYLTPYSTTAATGVGSSPSPVPSSLPAIDPADHSQPADAVCGRLAG